MLKTRRYKTIWDGTRRFVGFDKLRIDPMATEMAARAAVDATEVDALAKELGALEFNEENYIKGQVLKQRLAKALQRHESQVREYALANPIHFNPREGEEIICPLIENAKKT
jgi:hypothetical protein